MKSIMIVGVTLFLLLCTVRASEVKRSADICISVSPMTDINISSIVINSFFAYSIYPGSNISIPIYIYRGVTLKRTVYVWIEDQAGTRVSSKQKLSLSKRFTHYNLSANLSFSVCQSSGNYRIVAEGLDIVKDSSTALDFIDCIPQAVQSDGKIDYSVLKQETEVEPGNSFTTRIHISNPTSEYLEVSAWSYVYRSSKCVSGEREQNKKMINVPEHANITFDLENIVDLSTEPGDYKMKIRLLRSDRKTPKEITLPISVTATGQGTGERNKESRVALSINENKKSELVDNHTIEKRTLFEFPEKLNASKMHDLQTVYKSSSEKARKLGVYFLILVLVLVIVALVIKKL